MGSRRLFAGLALAAAAAVLAGCGVSGTVDPVASAATKSQQAGTARVEFTATMSSPTLGGVPLTMTGGGLVGDGRAELSMDMAGLFKQLGAPAGFDTTMKAVYLNEGGDYVFYLRMGMLDGKIPGGKQWLKLDLSKLGSSLGVDFDKLMGNASGPMQDPSQLLTMLRATSGDVQNLGTETVDGVEATHYRADVDLAKAAKLAGVSAPALEHLAQSVPSTMPEDVWIGTDGLVHRIRVAYTQTTQAAPMSMTMTENLTDYGTSATIAAPDSSVVYDATDLVLSTSGAPSS